MFWLSISFSMIYLVFFFVLKPSIDRILKARNDKTQQLILKTKDLENQIELLSSKIESVYRDAYVKSNNKRIEFSKYMYDIERQALEKFEIYAGKKIQEARRNANAMIVAAESDLEKIVVPYSSSVIKKIDDSDAPNTYEISQLYNSVIEKHNSIHAEKIIT